MASPVLADRLAFGPAELARRLGRSRSTIWRWIKAGKLRCSNGLIPAEDVAKLLATPAPTPRDPEAEAALEGM